jgi:hypothetical protein
MAGQLQARRESRNGLKMKDYWQSEWSPGRDEQRCLSKIYAVLRPSELKKPDPDTDKVTQNTDEKISH